MLSLNGKRDNTVALHSSRTARLPILANTKAPKMQADWCSPKTQS